MAKKEKFICISYLPGEEDIDKVELRKAKDIGELNEKMESEIDPMMGGFVCFSDTKENRKKLCKLKK